MIGNPDCYQTTKLSLQDNANKRLQLATCMPQYCLSYPPPHLLTSTPLALSCRGCPIQCMCVQGDSIGYYSRVGGGGGKKQPIVVPLGVVLSCPLSSVPTKVY